MKILVRAANWIGDQILSYPFFFHLRRAYPQARITAVATSWVSELQFRNLVDEVYIEERGAAQPFWKRWLDLERAAQDLRRQGPWQIGFALPPSFAAAWLLWRAGAARRIGYATDGRGFLLNDRRNAALDSSIHRAEAYLDLLPQNRRLSRDPGEFRPAPAFDSKSAWPGVAPLEPPGGPYWVMAPSSMAESRRWPVEFFIELARLIKTETGYSGIVVGGASDKALTERLCRESGLDLTDWTGRGPASALWRLFQEARFTVSNDSGLAHMAAICGSPLEVIWGAGDSTLTRPMGPAKIQIADNPVECWPCRKNTCFQSPAKHLQCLKGIDPRRVWQEIRQGLLANEISA